MVAGLKRAAESGVPSRLTSALAAWSPLTGRADAGARALIGPGRARDLAVNVVLPFCHAVAVVEQAEDSGQGYVQSYRRFGRLGDNELLREMRERLFSPDWAMAVDSARRQQGLLHLHHLLRGGG